MTTIDLSRIAAPDVIEQLDFEVIYQELLAEFKPELDRISVDTISSKSDGTPTIQRVRVIPGRG